MTKTEIELYREFGSSEEEIRQIELLDLRIEINRLKDKFDEYGKLFCQVKWSEGLDMYGNMLGLDVAMNKLKKRYNKLNGTDYYQYMWEVEIYECLRS